MAAEDADGVWVSGATLPLSARKARFGVAYVRSITSQAGWSLQETSPDEDMEAIDLTLHMAEGAVSVQVKCGTRVPRAGHISVPLEDTWIQKWHRKRHPVYLVYVRVPSDPRHWVSADTTETVHHATAYWLRVNGTPLGRSAKVPLDSTFSANVLESWRGEFLAGYQGEGSDEQH